MAIAFLALSRRERGAVTTSPTPPAGWPPTPRWPARGHRGQRPRTRNLCSFGLACSTNGWPVNYQPAGHLTNLYLSPRPPSSCHHSTGGYDTVLPDLNATAVSTQRLGNQRGSTTCWSCTIISSGRPEWIDIAAARPAVWRTSVVARLRLHRRAVAHLDLNAFTISIRHGANRALNPVPAAAILFPQPRRRLWKSSLPVLAD